MSELSRARWPDFYIVGAPRCGTSFLWHYLRQHPDVFMPDDKERPYFCKDLDTGTPMDRKMFLDKARYLARFEGARGCVGDACAYDLFSTTAAKEIHARRPDARILICVREPSEQMRAWHKVRMAFGMEDLEFGEALNAESARGRGELLPRNAHLVPMYQYRAVADFHEQVGRYASVFGNDQVEIVPLAEIRDDPAVAFQRVTRFVGLEDWMPNSFEVIGPTPQIRHRTLLRVVTDARLIDATKRIVPRPLHGSARRIAVAVRRRTW